MTSSQPVPEPDPPEESVTPSYDPAVADVPDSAVATAPVFFDARGRRRPWLVLTAVLVATLSVLVLVAVLVVLQTPSPTDDRPAVPAPATVFSPTTPTESVDGP